MKRYLLLLFILVISQISYSQGNGITLSVQTGVGFSKLNNQNFNSPVSFKNLYAGFSAENQFSKRFSYKASFQYHFHQAKYQREQFPADNTRIHSFIFPILMQFRTKGTASLQLGMQMELPMQLKVKGVDKWHELAINYIYGIQVGILTGVNVPLGDRASIDIQYTRFLTDWHQDFSGDRQNYIAAIINFNLLKK